MFDKHFEIFIADNQESKAIHYHLRYKVYCIERRWENPSEFPNQMESDGYDAHSVHFLARERATRQWIGGLRMVLGPYNDLPISQVCTAGEAWHGMPEAARSPIIAAEISRLHVLPKPRSVKTGPEQPANADRRPPPGTGPGRASEVMLGLIRAARDYSNRHNIHCWYFVTTKALGRILQGVGLDLEPIGAAVDYHGIRQPFYGDLNVFFDPMEYKNPAAHEMFANTKAPKAPGYQLFSELEEQGQVANKGAGRRYAHG